MLIGSLLLILTCMVLNALFSGLETGIISIHRMRLLHRVKQGLPRAKRLADWLWNTDRLLGTTLVGTNLSVVTNSVVAATLADRLFGAWGEVVSTVVTSLSVLVCCEYLPKAWFHSRPLERCLPFVGFLSLAERVLKPVSVPVLALTRLMLPGPSSVLSKTDPFVTRDELKALAGEGARNGVLSRHESDMIRRVFGLSGTRVRQVMVPRARMSVVHSGATLDEFLRVAREAGFTRYPLQDAQSGAFTGVLNVFYVLASRDMNGRAPDLSSLARAVLFVGPDDLVVDVLPRLRRARQPMCLVRDAAGAVVGLLTTDDIASHVVGSS